jgi:hypothetical protein
MRTGVTYMGNLNPRHVAADMLEMKDLLLDDLFIAIQEIDFDHFPGKYRYPAEIAADFGMRPIAIFWGALNLFGGGRSSQFLLEHPEGHQVGRDGSYRPEGCYVNPLCVDRIEAMIDIVAGAGYEGYFVDEPTPLVDCYCRSCRGKFEDRHGKNLAAAAADENIAFRHECVVDYVKTIADYCKSTHPQLETMTCLMPIDKSMWGPVAEIDTLDNLGTDIYWVNDDNDVEEMAPIVRELGAICKRRRKTHHEWLQCWCVKKDHEHRIVEQGKILIREQPDSLYVWAWKGQLGTSESCDDPEAAWQQACDLLREAKEH